MPDTSLLAVARARIGTDRFATEVQAGHHDPTHPLRADEPPTLDGADTGPSPYALVLAGLGACTTITLRMYADRKGWPLEGAEVSLRYLDGEATRVEREVRLTGALDDEQRARLLEVCERTPVTRMIAAGTTIRTTLV